MHQILAQNNPYTCIYIYIIYNVYLISIISIKHQNSNSFNYQFSLFHSFSIFHNATYQKELFSLKGTTLFTFVYVLSSGW